MISQRSCYQLSRRERAVMEYFDCVSGNQIWFPLPLLARDSQATRPNGRRSSKPSYNANSDYGTLDTAHGLRRFPAACTR